MSNFKLLDKLTIERQKASERARDVAEGKKLASAIDSLRKTYAEEQTKLRLFRDSTLQAIKDDIEKLESQKSKLLLEIETLKLEINNIQHDCSRTNSSN